MTLAAVMDAPPATSVKPRLGFIGTGWIGQLRMEALANSGHAEIAAICDSHQQNALEAQKKCAQDAEVTTSLEELLTHDLDGVVIATPSALHKEQCLAALAAKKAVFCQKPLARTSDETTAVIEAARNADRLLGIDFSYRYLDGVKKMRELINSGELGEIFSVELVFHNAYGPDKPWFYDFSRSGGGCVIDLGIHLIDLALWLLGPNEIRGLSSHLYKGGNRLQTPINDVEDYANIGFQLGNCDVQLGCSWNLHAGQDAVISARFFGTQGGMELRNVNGSFFDFETFHLRGTQRNQLASFPEDWGGRALCHWAQQLGTSPRFDAEVEQVATVAQIIDRIYQR
ncbi:Gfo/Idh/MocA family oxidoreductase [Alteromonas pelagimontana]|uniref:Gfo/Idh/MocA family oxidoreductase n=1 Tax=Alteromonas pelagimontana TaxID=1858656 RepID=A0A6M4MEJ7_9ALTE|nr:Gfo/Idh/MocA family oxidoreductase [Alteromonas pelagimontana]QJR80586.1 Gfo/Idh/MocA family oxidoreductase [Alteromonas pelagimontana]